MNVKKWAGVLLLVLLLVFTVGCKSDKAAGNQETDTAAVEIPIDIVSEVAGSFGEQQEDYLMDEEQQKNYKVLLDGCSDPEAVYYLYDLTGDGSVELIMGKETMSVYSYNQGSVMTIGTVPLQEAYLSNQYGFLAFYNNDGSYELRQYQYDGEMVTERVLVSASNSADYEARAASWLEDADELEPFELTDRTPFE